MALVRRYAVAFDHRDVGSLMNLLTPDVRISGAGAGYCAGATSRSEAASSFTAIFISPTRRLGLVGLDAGAVRLTGSRALVNVAYRVAGGPATPISFATAETAGAWRVARIASPCSAGHRVTGAAPPPPWPAHAAIGAPGVVQPRPGCRVVLTPTGRTARTPGRTVPRPSGTALARLCAGAGGRAGAR